MLQLKSLFINQDAFDCRYEKTERNHFKRPHIALYGLFVVLFIVLVTIFLFINNVKTFSFLNDSKRLIIFESTRNESEDVTLTTITNMYDENDFTTPMTYNLPKPGGLHFERERYDLFLDKNQSNQRSKSNANHEDMINLRNHRLNANAPIQRRQFTEDLSDPRPFNYVLKGTPPTAFETPKTTSTRTPNHFYGHVNNIQDILRQVQLADEEEDTRQALAPEHRSTRKMRFGGTYRHRKDSDISQMFGPSSSSYQQPYRASFRIPMTKSKKSPGEVVTDPFYPFKPHSMSDINLLAMNQFRFAPFHHGNTDQIAPMNPLDPSDLYQQIIAVNKNREAEELSRKNYRKGHEIKPKHKPFSLMLDIYPMLDEPVSEFPTRRPKQSLKFRAPFVMIPPQPSFLKSPNLINSINNLPLHFNTHYFQNMHFPQIKPQQSMQHPNEDAHNNYNQNMYFKKLQTNRGAAAHAIGNIMGQNNRNENNPSQVMVHLNLFPKHKSKHRKVDEATEKVEPHINERLGDVGELEIAAEVEKKVSSPHRLVDSDQNEWGAENEPVSMAIKVMKTTTMESLNTNEKLPSIDVTPIPHEWTPVWGGKVNFTNHMHTATEIPVEPRAMDFSETTTIEPTEIVRFTDVAER